MVSVLVAPIVEEPVLLPDVVPEFMPEVVPEVVPVLPIELLEVEPVIGVVLDCVAVPEPAGVPVVPMGVDWVLCWPAPLGAFLTSVLGGVP